MTPDGERDEGRKSGWTLCILPGDRVGARPLRQENDNYITKFQRRCQKILVCGRCRLKTIQVVRSEHGVSAKTINKNISFVFN